MRFTSNRRLKISVPSSRKIKVSGNHISFKKVNKDFKKIKSEFKRNSKFRLLTLLIALVLISIVLFFIGQSIENPNSETINKYIDTNKINEYDFPYHYVSFFEKETDDPEAILINFDETEEQFKILDGGTYRLKGTLNGSLCVECFKENVHLIFDNLKIYSDNGPALYIKNAQSVVISLVDDSENVLSDSSNYDSSSLLESCLYSNTKMTINGKGSLAVYGLYKDAIRSKDTVRIMDGNYFIQSKRTAIHGTDGIAVYGGNIEIECEKSAFKTTKNSVNHRGAIIVSDADISVIAGKYTFNTDSDVYMSNVNLLENSVSRYSTYKLR